MRAATDSLGQILVLIGDKNFRGKDFEADLATLDATIMRPRRKDECGRGPHLAPIRQRIESIFWTCKDILTLERHGARTLANLRVRLAARFAALTAAIALNYRLGRPSRSLACYTTQTRGTTHLAAVPAAATPAAVSRSGGSIRTS